MKELLLRYDLSPNQYFFLMAVHENSIPFKIVPSEVEDLQRKNYFITDDSGLHLSGAAVSMFTKEDETEQLFKEIWTLYPIRTPNGRVLRPSKIDSQMAKKIFRKLRKELTNYNNYKNIINGLKNEINNRSKLKDGLNYMQRLDTWVNQKSWESFQEEEESEEDGSVFDIG